MLANLSQAFDITAADLSPNGRVLAVLNYRSVHFYVRARGGAWAPALAPDAPHQHLVLVHF